MSQPGQLDMLEEHRVLIEHAINELVSDLLTTAPEDEIDENDAH